MIEFEIDKTGMSMLDIVKAYHEMVVNFIEKNCKREDAELIRLMIETVKEYQSKFSSNSIKIPLEELITWLKEKQTEAEKILEIQYPKESDYDVAKKRITDELPKFYLGQEVLTPIGKGLLVSLSMPTNGLYVSPERADCLVWFSTQDSKEGWVSQTYTLKEINPVVKDNAGKLSYGTYVKSTSCFGCLFHPCRNPCTLPEGVPSSK
jgi:hypothetical protein